MSNPSALPAPLVTKQINLGVVVGPDEYGQGPVSPTSGEDASKAFDSNTETKHYNPAGSKSGIEITYEDQTKLTSLSITTADKDPDRRLIFVTIPGASQIQRDPMAYTLYGYTASGWQELSGEI